MFEILAAVAPDGHHVFLAQPESGGQIDRKSSVAAAVVEHPPPVAENGGVVGHCPEREQDRAALPLLGREKLFPVAGKPLVIVLVAVVVGQGLDRVRDAHGGQLFRAVRLYECGGKDGGKQPAVVPIVVFHRRSLPR